MSVIKLKGFVLKEFNAGESGKRIVVFTNEMGKVTLRVNGGKNANSKYLSATQLFCYSEFVVYEGKGFLSVTQSDVIESFYPLRQDIVKLSYCSYILELVEKTSFEGIKDDSLVELLFRTLSLVAKTEYSVLLAVSIFEIKYLQLMGLLGEMDVCPCCGKELTHGGVYFTSQVGGICNECKNGLYDGREILSGTRLAIKHVISSDGKSMFSFKVSKAVEKELKEILEEYISEHINQKFQTLEFAKSCSLEE